MSIQSFKWERKRTKNAHIWNINNNPIKNIKNNPIKNVNNNPIKNVPLVKIVSVQLQSCYGFRKMFL